MAKLLLSSDFFEEGDSQLRDIAGEAKLLKSLRHSKITALCNPNIMQHLGNNDGVRVLRPSDIQFARVFAHP